MINWNKIQRRNPQNGSLRWYPTIALNSFVTADDVILGIVGRCTLTAVDVKAVLIALEEVIIEQLQLGNSVRFGTLGSFRPTIKSRLWDEKKQKWVHGGCYEPNDVIDPDTGEVATKGVTADNIAGIQVCFTKSAEMQKKLARQNLHFNMVEGEKAFPIKD